jgi:type II secretory pathway component GspD/PulD (secretin)
MQNVLKFLIVAMLTCSTVVAQEKTDSVGGVMKDLGSYTGKAPATTVKMLAPTSGVVNLVPEIGTGTANPADKEKNSAKVVAELDVSATLEASRELYTVGEFEEAQHGFEAVIKKDPENIVARIYLRKLLERDFCTAEIQGMKAVASSWDTALMLRSYTVSGDAAVKMGFEKLVDSTDVTRKFSEVKFPSGASAIYQPETSQLFVRNTSENLTVLEEILTAMDIARFSTAVDQVEIESKFIEMSEGTLEQLGFEWNFDNSVPFGGSDITANDGAGLFANTLRGSSQSPTLPFDRSSGALSADTGDLAGGREWKAFRFEDTFNTSPASMEVRRNGSDPVSLLISALDQTTGTDVLSAPRIVTQSGEKATIRVGELHSFPGVYEAGGSEGTIAHVKYVDFAEKLLGVEMDVTPKVDGKQINLQINPKIYELQGWQSDQIAAASSSYGTWQGAIRLLYAHDPVVGRLPIFKRREIKTEATIADGATMGIGGLVNERIEKYEDKIPVLGSLPLIGRLFRSEGERAVKRNLMIFVTAKKISPSGRINTSRSFE